jgi:3-oxoacyl-[acyl-carrier-protein] synthase II
MRNALKMAGINADQVQYVNPHATSTHLGDLAENHAIKTVFGDHATSGKLAIGATKSMTGHLLGASGGIETIMTAKVLDTGDCPPTVNFQNPDEGCTLNYIANTAQQHDVRYGMSNNFGFGGHNISLLLAKV